MIVWDDRYAIGQAMVDGEHRQLFDQLAQLFEIFRLGNPGGSATELIDQADAALAFLHQYTVQHLAHEEELMAAIEFPELELHRLLHREFILDLDHFSENYQRDRHAYILLLDMIGLLSDWLVNHILDEDQKIGRFLRGEGVVL